MRKKMFVFNGKRDFAKIVKAIKNAFTEDGKACAEALTDFIAELEASEEELDAETLAEMLKDKLDELVEAKVAEEVANAMAKKIQALQNSMNKTELSASIKNQISAVILNSSRNEIEDNVNSVLVKNGISGLTFADVVDYAIVDAWGDSNPVFAKLHKSFANKFFYSADELATARILAKQWDSVNAEDVEKEIQNLVVTGKTINTDYVYKRQAISRKDLSKIEKQGQTTNFLRWLNEELDRQIVNTIMMAILVGDNVNAEGSKVTTFESIATKSASDIFTTIVNSTATVAENVTLADVRKMCDAVKNPYGKEKYLFVTSAVKTAISAFVYGEGGTTDFRSEEEIASKLGVDKIVTYDWLSSQDANVGAICMIPDGYWYVEDEYFAVSYPTHEKNVVNYQKERNAGGGIHDLHSTAFLKLAE